MRSIPLSLQAVYQDLVEARRALVLMDAGGKPFLKSVPGKGGYWYARQRVGDRTVDRYLGRDTPELQARLAVLEAGDDDRRSLEERCALWVAQLRAGGLPTLDRETGKVLNAMARVGVFRLGGTLVGTHAYRLMSAELGVRLDEALAVTEDVDIAAFEHLKLVIDDAVAPSLAETFRDLKLQPVPGLDPRQRPTSWRMPGGGAKIDFLAPYMKPGEETRFLEPLGVHAQTLTFLNYLIAEPTPAVGLYRGGVLVQIPRPERFAVHKLIVAHRRSGPHKAKARKDIAQSEALIGVLVEDRPELLAAAYRDARAQGAAWRGALDAVLARRPQLKMQLETCAG